MVIHMSRPDTPPRTVAQAHTLGPVCGGQAGPPRVKKPYTRKRRAVLARYTRTANAAAAAARSVPLGAPRPPCIASELGTASVSCGLARSAGWGRIAACVSSPPLPDHDPGLWPAATGPQPRVQKCLSWMGRRDVGGR